ncbi:hypothetical protein ACSBPU_13010 [Parapusillimonas sp. JC17]|uniref:hypothetical protein n=1 Tax=Parapusillimonas sp. JC17 TaxID=3445768 RepID=UPI003FA163B0
MKITGTIDAYLTDTPYRQEAFLAAMKNGSHSEAVGALNFSNTPGMEIVGWVRLGTATITVDVPDEDAIRLGYVETLKAKKAQVLADAQREVVKIEEKIQSLLAITNEVVTS